MMYSKRKRPATICRVCLSKRPSKKAVVVKRCEVPRQEEQRSRNHGERGERFRDPHQIPILEHITIESHELFGGDVCQ